VADTNLSRRRSDPLWSSAADSLAQGLAAFQRNLAFANQELRQIRGSYERLLQAVSKGPLVDVGDEPTRSEITLQERRVLVLVALGKSNREIAALLKVSVHTTKSHVKNIMHKLGLRSRWQLQHINSLSGNYSGCCRDAGAASLPATGLVIDWASNALCLDGQRAALSKREAQLIGFFLANPNRFYTASDLVGRAWHSSQLSPEQIRAYVGRLRRKLRSLDSAVRLLAEVRRGYCLATSNGDGDRPTE